jgi:ADP-ribose diphosphatase
MIKRIGEKTIFKTKLFTVKDIDLQASEKKVTFQIIEKNNTALIVPILGDEIVFVYEYFAAIDQYSLSLPKGRVENEEEALFTANKELQEEIGYKAENIKELALLTMSPGYLTQKTHVFLAQDLKESKKEGDELEKLEIRKYTFDKFEELIENGELTEARTIAALYLARRELKKK